LALREVIALPRPSSEAVLLRGGKKGREGRGGKEGKVRGGKELALVQSPVSVS